MANRLKMALIDAILSLKARRWSNRRIAVELDVDRDTVARHLRRAEQANAAKVLIGAGEAPAAPNAAKVLIGSDGGSNGSNAAKAPIGAKGARGSTRSGRSRADTGDAETADPQDAKEKST